VKTFVLILAMAVSTASTRAAELRVATVAGVFGVAGSRDGVPGVGTFDHPTWLGFDKESGALYVVDRNNKLVRRIDSGAINSVVVKVGLGGSPIASFDFGGPFGGGIAVEPAGAGCGAGAFDYGFYLSASAEDRVVLIATKFAVLADRDFAPKIGVPDTPGDRDGDAALAQFRTPTAIALSWGYQGTFQSVASDRVYIADTGNHTIRQVRMFSSAEQCPGPGLVETLAGTAGQAGSVDGQGQSARFNSPRGMVAAPDGSIYVADSGNHTIRRITRDGLVTTVAGEPGVRGSNDGAARMAHLNTPSGIDIDSNGDFIIADTGNGTIRKLTADGQLQTIAGVSGVGGYADGFAGTALFNGPVGVKVVGDTIYIADTSNNVIRSLTEVPSRPPRRAARH
jgi:sugar lactone lactonase YvrE